MDALKSEVQKFAAVDEALRPPLVPSEKHNAAPATRGRDVASRYKSGLAASTTRRCTSPSLGRASAAEGTPVPQRAQSADRRRPSTPSTPYSRVSRPSSPPSMPTTPVCDNVTQVHSTSRRVISAKAPDGLWPAMRNLSSSFQSGSVAGPANRKDKVVSGSSLDRTKGQASALAERKRSPLKGKNIDEQCENAYPSENPPKSAIEQHRWPAMITGRVSANLMSGSTDLSDKASRSVLLSNPSRGLPRRRPAFEGTGKLLNQSLDEIARRLAIDASRRVDKADSGSDVSSHTSERSKSVSRQSRTISSPVPVLHHSALPSKVLLSASSTSRAFQSPSRTRPSTSCQSQSAATTRPGAASPVINYIIDARKGKKNASQIENIHQLRLLYNRYSQWLSVNARTGDTLSSQKTSVESILYNVWRSTLIYRDAVKMRRIEVQHLQQELKLYSILKEQIAYLEEWPALEEENINSLFGATEALKASTLRLPVTSGARADAVALKNAISSAVDVMQALGFSICYLLSKVEGRASLVSELSVIAGQEKVMLDECRELLATAITLQAQESSLQTHLMQLRQGLVEMN